MAVSSVNASVQFNARPGSPGIAEVVEKLPNETYSFLNQMGDTRRVPHGEQWLVEI